MCVVKILMEAYTYEKRHVSTAMHASSRLVVQLHAKDHPPLPPQKKTPDRQAAGLSECQSALYRTFSSTLVVGPENTGRHFDWGFWVSLAQPSEGGQH